MFTSITVNPTVTPPPSVAPGYYANLEYVFGDCYGDCYGDEQRLIGPIPCTHAHLTIELANLCEAILTLYRSGKGCDEAYEELPGYTEWFDTYKHRNSPDPDQQIRNRFDACTIANDYVSAQLVSYDIYYIDDNNQRHEVTLT